MPSQQAEDDQEGMMVLHRASMIDWKPTPLVSLASSRDGSLVVGLRESGDLELYETPSLHKLQTIPGNADAAPTCLAVVDDDHIPRIFSAGLDGSILEYDTETLQIVAASDSYGGAVWQLAPEPVNTSTEPAEESETTTSTATRLAAACDDGCVRLFTIEPSARGVSYSKSLPRVEGRILALAWHPSGKYIASAGTDGCIRIWELGHNREVVRITAADASGKELCIWSLAFLPDGNIVSGDSNGNVCIWEGKYGTLIQRFTQHKADVLQIATSPDGNTVFAAGVDPQIAVFRKLNTEPGAQQKWAFLSAKRPHTHDVRAMCVAFNSGNCSEALLLTGGNDTLLYSHSVDRFLKEHPVKVDPCPQKPMLFAMKRNTTTLDEDDDDQVQRSPWLLAVQRNQVDVWQLATPNDTQIDETAEAFAVEGAPVAPRDQPWHIARINNASGRHFTAAAGSDDGTMIALSDANKMMCFLLSEEQQQSDGDGADNILPVLLPHVRVVPVGLPANLPAPTHVAFRGGHARQLITCGTDGTIRLLEITKSSSDSEEGSAETIQAQVVHTMREVHDLRYKMWYKRDVRRTTARRAAAVVDFLIPSADGLFLAVLVRGRVFILNLDTGRLVGQLPPLPGHAPILSVAFTADSAAVVVVGAHNEVAVFTVPEGVPTQWTQTHIFSSNTTTVTAKEGDDTTTAPATPPSAATLPKRLVEFPRPIAGLATDPNNDKAVMLYSSEAVCYIDFTKPIAKPHDGDDTQEERKAKRRRRDRKNRHSGVKIGTPAGQNCRALYCNDPVLHVQFLDGQSLLVVERSWNEVYKGLPPPMYRHRYGT